MSLVTALVIGAMSFIFTWVVLTSYEGVNSGHYIEA